MTADRDGEGDVMNGDNMEKSMATSEATGPRLIGPHGGLKAPMPSPTAVDLASPLFNAIWNATKTWDVNVPEHYVGYCGMNGSHVMLIVNAIRAASLAEGAGGGEPAALPVVEWPEEPSAEMLDEIDLAAFRVSVVFSSGKSTGNILRWVVWDRNLDTNDSLGHVYIGKPVNLESDSIDDPPGDVYWERKKARAKAIYRAMRAAHVLSAPGGRKDG